MERSKLQIRFVRFHDELIDLAERNGTWRRRPERTALRILAAYQAYADTDGWSDPTKEEIAELAGVNSPHQVGQKRTAFLVKHGILEKKRRKNLHAAYRVNIAMLNKAFRPRVDYPRIGEQTRHHDLTVWKLIRDRRDADGWCRSQLSDLVAPSPWNSFEYLKKSRARLCRLGLLQQERNYNPHTGQRIDNKLRVLGDEDGAMAKLGLNGEAPPKELNAPNSPHEKLDPFNLLDDLRPHIRLLKHGVIPEAEFAETLLKLIFEAISKLFIVPSEPDNGAPLADHADQRDDELLVTYADIARLTGNETATVQRNWAFKQSWPQPAVPKRGRMPARFRWSEVRESLTDKQLSSVPDTEQEVRAMLR